MKLKQTPQQWEFANLEKKRSILKILSEVVVDPNSDDPLDLDLQYFVLRACAYAATYDSDSDRFRLKRKKQTAEEAARDKAIAAVSKLRKTLKALPSITTAAVSHVRAVLPARGVRLLIDDEVVAEDPVFAVAVDMLLEELSTGLNRSPLGMRNGSYEHRTRNGCLLYPESIEGKSHQAQADTMLLFATVLHFRRHSLGLRGLMQGQGMPEDGASHYKLAAAIVQVIFPDSRILCAKSAEGRLSQLLSGNPGISLMAWPHEPP